MGALKGGAPGPAGMPLGSYLAHIGVQGYGAVEPVVLAALISGDPLLLVGRAGTGKTFLLNSLSEVLGLEHRHYNASMISFDDLVGFPAPDGAGGVAFLRTPATVWGAESVLVDELNRCRPEHANRFFSLIHERRLQGLSLTELRYRWAAMNPVEPDGGELYVGCEPLDPALADRFAFVIRVQDWAELTEEEQRAVADPRGDGAVSCDGGALKAFIAEREAVFAALVAAPPEAVVRYCTVVATELNEAHHRISPRRVRQWVRNACALLAAGLPLGEEALRTMLQWSLPQRAVVPPDEAVVRAAHRMGWQASGGVAEGEWLFRFHRAGSVRQAALLREAPHPDTGTLAVAAALDRLEPAWRVAFAWAVLPRLMAASEPAVGTEGLNDLAEHCHGCLHIDREIRWREPTGGEPQEAVVPALAAALALPACEDELRRSRFAHLVSALLAANIPVPMDLLAVYEDDFNAYWNA